MESIFRVEGNRLIREYDGEKMWIKPCDENSLQFHCTMEAKMPGDRDLAF